MATSVLTPKVTGHRESLITDSHSTLSSGSNTGQRCRVLGRQYELLRRLGQGSFGIAYLARDMNAPESAEL